MRAKWTYKFVYAMNAIRPPECQCIAVKMWISTLAVLSNSVVVNILPFFFSLMCQIFVSPANLVWCRQYAVRFDRIVFFLSHFIWRDECWHFRCQFIHELPVDNTRTSNAVFNHNSSALCFQELNFYSIFINYHSPSLIPHKRTHTHIKMPMITCKWR